MIYPSIIRYRDFIRYTLKSERHARVAGTILHSLWFYVLPLTQVLAYYFLIQIVFARGISDANNRFIIIVIGVMHYTILAQTLTAACNSIIQRAHVLMNMKVEPAVFVAITFYGEMRRGLELIVIVAAFYIYFGEGPHLTLVVYPFLIVAFAIILWGGSLVLAVANVYARDVSQLVRMVLQVLIYFCPAIYHFTFVPQKYWVVYFANPIAGLFAWIQWSLLGGQVPPVAALLWTLSFSGLVLLVAHWVYAKGTPQLTKRF